MYWLPINTAPRIADRRIRLLIPYNCEIFTEDECTDVGYWDGECWRFDGDDGQWDMQPTHWKPL